MITYAVLHYLHGHCTLKLGQGLKLPLSDYCFGIAAHPRCVALARVISKTELKAVTIVQKDHSVLQPFIQKFRKFAQL